MEPLLLKDGNIFPEKEVLKAALKNSAQAYEKLCDVLSENHIIPEWNYYKDGKAWLCKMMLKKKNIGWIHVYDGFFTVTFYFTEKYLEAIAGLEIAEQIKEDFCKGKPVGKLLPMTIHATDGEAVQDIAKVIQFKKGLK